MSEELCCASALVCAIVSLTYFRALSEACCVVPLTRDDRSLIIVIRLFTVAINSCTTQLRPSVT